MKRSSNPRGHPRRSSASSTPRGKSPKSKRANEDEVNEIMIVDSEESSDFIEEDDEDDSVVSDSQEIEAELEPIEDKEPTPAKRRKIVASCDILDDEFESPAIESIGDFGSLPLRADHANRPIWICPDCMIYLEAFHPQYKEAYDFLIAIATPVSRTHFMHAYKLNQGSLYAAVSIGMNTDQIMQVLDKMSKVNIPAQVTKFVESCTARFGKVKIVLKKNGYFIESFDRAILERVMADDVIAAAAINPGQVIIENEATAAISFPSELDSEQIIADLEEGGFQESANADNQEAARHEDAAEQSRQPSFAFEIIGAKFEDVKRRCIELDYPLLEEYDFNKDTHNPSIPISLKASTMLRKYQEKALSKMFNNGRVRSGIISLPCGAGKTLVGVVAATTIKKRTLVLCTGGVSVQQWAFQFKLWSNIHHNNVVCFTSGSKSKILRESDLGSVLVTTYSMLSNSGRRAGQSEHVIRLIESQEWGLIILDEVHVVPANTFRRVISRVKSHCKLGLTATLVREDDMIEHLLYLIGPKLYEANWLDLVRAGHIANVRCAEVWCPMTAEFYAEYLAAEPRRQQVLYTMNPNKIRTCEHLVRFHEQRDDKIIVFSDNVFALKHYSKLLDRPYIYGGTPTAERIRIFSQFQYNASVKTIFVSKVGDNSIDLPEANVIIQISAHYGSRRQEAQRLGRILRPKNRVSGKKGPYDAFFYSLVSQDTREMYYSAKRQQFLVDQGYGYRVLQHLHNSSNITCLSSQQDQLHLLAKILAENLDSIARADADDADEDQRALLLSQIAEEQNAPPSSQQPTGAAEAAPVMPNLLQYTRTGGGASANNLRLIFFVVLCTNVDSYAPRCAVSLEALAGGSSLVYDEMDYD